MDLNHVQVFRTRVKVYLLQVGWEPFALLRLILIATFGWSNNFCKLEGETRYGLVLAVQNMR